jgi:L-lactate dehydrogenase complex protein LldG
MSPFHKIIANVRAALERKPAPILAHDAAGATPQLLSVAARRAELTAQFARELERVGGIFLGSITQAELRDQITVTAQKIAAKSIVVGDGITLDANAIGKAITRNAIDLIRPDRIRDDARADLRDRIARSDLGVIEADYAIAATGTFCIVATAKRPSSITILPPVNFIVVAADHILPTLADVIAAVGPDQFARRRVALITGPSRTADIEKMIVIGVHGPKELYAAVIIA